MALAQLERLGELVAMRVEVARLYQQAVAGCAWLTPQATPVGYIHSYWSYVVHLSPDVDFSWYDFRNKYKELGGDGIYAAWQLNYLEPAFRQVCFHPEQPQRFERGLCPVAETVQPGLLQFKTNYFDLDMASQKAEALAKTIAYFQ